MGTASPVETIGSVEYWRPYGLDLDEQDPCTLPKPEPFSSEAASNGSGLVQAAQDMLDKPVQQTPVRLAGRLSVPQPGSLLRVVIDTREVTDRPSGEDLVEKEEFDERARRMVEPNAVALDSGNVISQAISGVGEDGKMVVVRRSVFVFAKSALQNRLLGVAADQVATTNPDVRLFDRPYGDKIYTPLDPVDYTMDIRQGRQTLLRVAAASMLHRL